MAAASERVLVTALADLDWVEARARALGEAALVGLGSADEVRAARRRCAGLANVLFVCGTRDEIPWMDGWFTLILDEAPESASPEMRRVLAEGGRIEAAQVE